MEEETLDELLKKVNKLDSQIRKEVAVTEDLANKYKEKHDGTYNFTKSEADTIFRHYKKVSSIAEEASALRAKARNKFLKKEA